MEESTNQGAAAGPVGLCASIREELKRIKQQLTRMEAKQTMILKMVNKGELDRPTKVQHPIK